MDKGGLVGILSLKRWMNAVLNLKIYIYIWVTFMISVDAVKTNE